MIFSYKDYSMDKAVWLAKERNQTSHKGAAMSLCSLDFINITNESKPCDELEGLGKFLQRDIVYSPVTFNNNHRKIENAILEVDMLIFDIDDGLTLKDVYVLPYKIMLLTTTSHTKEHNKFRVFIPLTKKITFDSPEHYKLFYKKVGEELFNGLDDKACREPGRAYIGHNNSKYVINRSVTSYNGDSHYFNASSEIMMEKILEKNKPKILKFNNFKQIKPEHIKTSKLQEYLSNVYDGNYHNGTISLIGYLNKCGCTKEDIRNYIKKQTILLNWPVISQETDRRIDSRLY